MAKNLNPQDIANKWLSGMQNGVNAYKQGVQSVNESPTAKAAAAQDKYLAGIQDAVSSGRYRDGCNSVSLQSWQQSALDRGANRLASGASASKSKMQNFLSQYIPQVQAISAQIAQMPNSTPEQAKARMNANFDALKALKGQFKGR